MHCLERFPLPLVIVPKDGYRVFGGFQREALTRMKTHYTLHLILATSLLLAPVAAGAPPTPVQRVTPDSVSPQAPTSKPTLTDLSWLAGLVVGGLLYYLLSMRSVPAEQASSELEEAA